MKIGVYLTIPGLIRFMLLQDVEAVSLKSRRLSEAGASYLRRQLGVPAPNPDDLSPATADALDEACTFGNAQEAHFCEKAGEVVIDKFCKGVDYAKYRKILDEFHSMPLRKKLLSIASGQNHASRKRLTSALESRTKHDFFFWFSGLFYSSKMAAVAAISASLIGFVGWIVVLIPCTVHHAYRTRDRKSGKTLVEPLPMKSILKDTRARSETGPEFGCEANSEKVPIAGRFNDCAGGAQDFEGKPLKHNKKSVRFRFDDNTLKNGGIATSANRPRPRKRRVGGILPKSNPADLPITATQRTLFLNNGSLAARRGSIPGQPILNRESPQLFDEAACDPRTANIHLHAYPLQAQLTIPPNSFGGLLNLRYEFLSNITNALHNQYSLKVVPNLFNVFRSLRITSLFVLGIISSTLTIHTVLKSVYSKRRLELEMKATRCFATKASHDLLYFSDPSESVPFVGFERLFRILDEAKSMMPKFRLWVETREHARILAEAASLALSPLRTTDYLLHRQAFYWNQGSVSSLNHRSLAALVHQQLNPNRTASEHLGELIDAGRKAPFNKEFLLNGLKSVENLLDQTISVSHDMSALLSQVSENVISKQNVYWKLMTSLSPLVYATILEVLGCITLYFIHYLPGWKGCGKWKREAETLSVRRKIILRDTEEHGYLVVGHAALTTGTALFVLSMCFLIFSRIGRDSCGYFAEEMILNGVLDTVLLKNQTLNQLGPTCLSQDASGDLFEATMILNELEKLMSGANVSYRERFAEYSTRANSEESRTKWMPRYSQDLDIIVNLDRYLKDDVTLPQPMTESNARLGWLDTNSNLWKMTNSDVIISVEVNHFPISSLSYEDRVIECDNKLANMSCEAIAIVHPELAGSSEIRIWGIKHLIQDLENMMPADCQTRICLDADSGGTCGREPTRIAFGRDLLKISPATIQYISLDPEDARHRLGLHTSPEGRKAATCFERVDAVGHQKWAEGLRLLATKSMALSRPIRYGRNDVYEFSKMKSSPPGDTFSESCGIFQPCQIFVVNTELRQDPISNMFHVNYLYVNHHDWEATFESKLKAMRIQLTYAESFNLLKFLGYEYSMLQPLRQLLHTIHDQINCTYIQKLAIEVAYMGCNRALPELEKLGLSFFCLGIVNYLVCAVLYSRWWKLRSIRRLEQSKVMKESTP